MGDKFSLQVDPWRNLVRIMMTGFFSHDDILAFLEARRRAHRQLTCGPHEHLTINDVRGVNIQTQDVIDAFRKILAAPEYRSRRLAFVVPPTLARNQATRACVDRDARCFQDPVAAETWLFSEEADRAPSLPRPDLAAFIRRQIIIPERRACR